MTKLPQKIKQKIPFLPLFIDEVQEARSLIVEKQKRRKRITITAGLSFMAFSSFIGYFKILGINPEIGSLISSLGFGFFWYDYYSKKKDNKRFSTIFEDNVNTFITESVDANWEFSTDKIVFDSQDKRAGKIFAQDVKTLKKHFQIKGQYLGHPLRLIKFKTALAGQQSNGLYRSNDLFQGYLLTLDFKRNMDRKAVIAPKLTYQNLSNTGTQLLGLHQKGYVLQPNLETSFNQHFKVYTRKENTLPTILTPTLQRQLAYFVKDKKIQVHLFFNENRLYISIRTGKKTDLPKINETFDIHENAVLFYEELQIIEVFLKRLEQGQLFK